MPSPLDPRAALEHPEQLYERLRLRLTTLLAERAIAKPLMVGIHAGGYALAQRLHEDLGLAEPLGSLNIAFYRDDFAQTGLSHSGLARLAQNEVQAQAHSAVPVDINQRHVLLIDDILYTGRTIRAAMNELFDFGRPASIILGCLISRDGRQLPLQADACGAEVRLASNQVIKLRQVKPMLLSLQERIR